MISAGCPPVPLRCPSSTGAPGPRPGCGPPDSGLLLLALVVGAGAGLGAVVFRYLITLFTKVLSGQDDYSDAGRVAHSGARPSSGPWFVVLTPVVAGLLYGPLVYFFAREARGHGVPEVMYAVARRGGRIKPQVALVKALASALTIGGGGSVGREGPIVQIGVGAGLDAGSAHPGRRGTDAGAGGLRRRRRHRRDVQRAAGRGVLRHGADPDRLRRALLRHGGRRLA